MAAYGWRRWSLCVVLVDSAGHGIAWSEHRPYRRPMTRLLTTDEVDTRDRLAYWNDAVSAAYVSLTCDTPTADVVGDIRVDSLATLELSQVTATAQRVQRTPSLIASTAEDYFLVSI